METILRDIEGAFTREGSTGSSLHAILLRVLAHFACEVGTIHRLDPDSQTLKLEAQRGVPDGLLERVREIPIGKGIAGLAAQRREPVQVCNLQTDGAGVAAPRARETRMEGSIAVPMLSGFALRGTLGIAKPTSHTFSEAETALLLRIASLIGEHL